SRLRRAGEVVPMSGMSAAHRPRHAASRRGVRRRRRRAASLAHAVLAPRGPTPGVHGLAQRLTRLEERELLRRGSYGNGKRSGRPFVDLACIPWARLADLVAPGELVDTAGDLLLVGLGRVGAAGIQSFVLRDEIGMMLDEPCHVPLSGPGPKVEHDG